MSSSGAGPLVPTFHGFVSNSMDGLTLFEGCLSGKLHHVPRRPHDRERAQLIKSGSIFIYEENASGIKRWTDGVAWSPSRILGNFLIYRELEKPFPPGEKKRAMKRKRQSVPGEPYPRRDSDENEVSEQITPITPPEPTPSTEVKSETATTEQDKDVERALIGSLVDSYGFRPDGLVKKTMSISINGISHHMVSYYKVDDVKNSKLPRPMTDPRLQGISIRPELYLKQNFRSPVEETEHYAMDGNMHAHPHMLYSMQTAPYAMRPGQYFAGQQYQSMYPMPQPAPNTYTNWSSQQPSSAVPYRNHAAYGGQGYANYYKPEAQTGKTEDATTSSQTMPYTSQYASAYPHPQTQGQTGRPEDTSTSPQTASYASQYAYSNPNYYNQQGQGIKPEDPTTSTQTMSYTSQYAHAPTYSQMPRGSAQSTPSMVQSAYQSPVHPNSPTFGSMSARPSYSSTMPAQAYRP